MPPLFPTLLKGKLTRRTHTITSGADISMTSGTKYIGGHGDVTLGMLAVRGAELAKRVYFLQVGVCGSFGL